MPGVSLRVESEAGGFHMHGGHQLRTEICEMSATGGPSTSSQGIFLQGLLHRSAVIHHADLHFTLQEDTLGVEALQHYLLSMQIAQSLKEVNPVDIQGVTTQAQYDFTV